MANRKSIRLKGWDYSSLGAYHVTICTKSKEKLFGDVADGHMVLSALGTCCLEAISDVHEETDCFVIDSYVVMPNHVHLLISIEQGSLQLGRIVANIKSRVTRLARIDHPGIQIWQRGYYDHIIRGERDYLDTIAYIEDNPRKWDEDRLYTGR